MEGNIIFGEYIVHEFREFEEPIEGCVVIDGAEEFIEETYPIYITRKKIYIYSNDFSYGRLMLRARHSFAKGVSFIVLSLYRWIILPLTSLPLTQSYDGISKKIRRIYLIHHRRTTSVTDYSAICGIA